MEKALKFTLAEMPKSVPNEGIYEAYLLRDRWDDWGEFETMYHLFIFDETGRRLRIGEVKIGEYGLKPLSRGEAMLTQDEGYRWPTIPQEFAMLSEKHFSLGQDESYYEMLGKLSNKLRDAVSQGMRDIVSNASLLDRIAGERVIWKSLLRSVTLKSVEGQFRRLFHGGIKLTPFSFTYESSRRSDEDLPIKLFFKIEPDSSPPSNIHVIIGRNGVGKTYLLNQMTKSLVAKPPTVNQSGGFATCDADDDGMPFANVVTVSFSAFDSFDCFLENSDSRTNIKYSYIGLRHPDKNARGLTKSLEDLESEFSRSRKLCHQGPKAARWLRALQLFESDPNFEEAGLALLTKDQRRENEEYIYGEIDFHNGEDVKIFRGLSSGHKIVLLTITRLVEVVEEKTIVFLDEPEAHLHPPLLSAFIRALSDLLMNRNGVAIIATHSPVVIQEVPADCVWKLRRGGLQSNAARPENETFGENVGVLTREVFGLEVVNTGFHRILKNAANAHSSFEEAVNHFNGKLGAEARAILKGFFLVKPPVT